MKVELAHDGPIHRLMGEFIDAINREVERGEITTSETLQAFGNAIGATLLCAEDISITGCLQLVVEIALRKIEIMTPPTGTIQ